MRGGIVSLKGIARAQSDSRRSGTPSSGIDAAARRIARRCPYLGETRLRPVAVGAGAASLRGTIVDDDATWPLTRIDLAKGRPGAIPRPVFWCLKFVERRRVAAGASSGGRMTAGIGRPPRFVNGGRPQDPAVAHRLTTAPAQACNRGGIDARRARLLPSRTTPCAPRFEAF